MATITGTSGNDTINSTDADDTIYGLDGNDSIEAAGGEDVVFGGAGDDRLSATGASGGANDTFYGGSGNDSILGETGDDLIFGGTGNDTIDGKEDRDTIYGGDGDDSIDAGKQDDTVYAGSGDDFIRANEGNDTIFAGTGNDSILGGKGDAVIYGGDGADTVDGESGSDTIYGGAGADSLAGGSGADTLFGGDGNDILDGGSNADRLVGGAGDDTLTGGSGTDSYVVEFKFGNDRITDFDTGNEVIEVRSANVTSFADIQSRMTDTGPDTLITFDDGSTLLIQNTNPGDFTASNFIIGSPVCYATGTLILTDRGERAVEDLRAGDRLVTADRGAVPILWIGRTEHVWAPGPHKHKPIEIKVGALGDGLPRRRLVVSPQHHMLLAGPVVREMFGEREVLALARALTGLDHVRAMNGKREVTYYSLLCESHQLIQAEGAWSESFYPGPTALEMIGPAMRRQIEALVPAVRADREAGYGPKVRRTLSRKETEALVAALLARGFGRVDDEIARWKREAEFARWGDDLRRERMVRDARTPRPCVVNG